MGSQESSEQKQLRQFAGDQYRQGQSDYSAAQREYMNTYSQARAALANDFGSNGQDYLRKTEDFGHKIAGDTINRQAAGARASAAASMRQGGTSAGAAGLAGAGAASDAWGNYQSALESGRGLYQNTAQNYQTAIGSMMDENRAQQQFAANKISMAMGGQQAATATSKSPWSQNWQAFTGGMQLGSDVVGTFQNAKSKEGETGSDYNMKDNIQKTSAPNYSEELYKRVQKNKEKK